MHRYIALAIVLSASLLLTGCSSDPSFTELDHLVIIGDQTIPVYLANTSKERSIGLGDTALEPNQGMVFTWSQAAKQTFWMKDVEYPIDIVWILDGKVIGSVTAQPEKPGTLVNDYKFYPSPDKVDMVIELPAGTMSQLGLKVADNCTLTRTLDGD